MLPLDAGVNASPTFWNRISAQVSCFYHWARSHTRNLFQLGIPRIPIGDPNRDARPDWGSQLGVSIGDPNWGARPDSNWGFMTHWS
eukprot:COSAG03_NODE_6090_length_1118_cov_0.694799_1_plen_85_part_10